jgi:hypothetical protein
MLLCGCSNNSTFKKNKNNNIVSNSGVEYALLANEGVLYYLGNLEFAGSIKGEEKTSQHLGMSYQTGMFSIKDADNDNILIRRAPNNEWCAIYRKASLPNFDFSVDNCIRLEFVSGIGNIEEDAVHTTCGDGITDQSEISTFLSEIRMQKDPDEAGLYDLIMKPDGMLENCYVYGVIYGFFDDEPNLALQMEILSFNDLAYSISIEGKEYVLPAEWLQKLENR